jgi:hypothetical protein
VTGPSPETPERPAASFAHASEAEMARILDFYAVRWEYEPKTFPILWNLEGDVVESFSPDFYLPDLDMFLEMTTLKQNLVRKKNRKLRRLRELYPDIRIKLFYARDFAAMMLKYGRFALVDSLSGTVGQMVPDRSATSGQVFAVLPVEPTADRALTADAATIAAMAAAPSPAPTATSSTMADAPEPTAAGIAALAPETPRRSRTAARRLRRRHLRATGLAGVANAANASAAPGATSE